MEDNHGTNNNISEYNDSLNEQELINLITPSKKKTIISTVNKTGFIAMGGGAGTATGL